MRYIIAKNSKTGERRPFTGLVPTTHKDLCRYAESDGFDQIESAAFVHMGPASGVTVHHRSESLNLGPGPDDAALIHIFYRATLDLVPEFQLRKAGQPDSRITGQPDSSAACPKCEATGNADPLKFP